MTNISHPLSSPLPEPIYKVLFEVFEAADKLQIPAFVIGALARDIILEYIFKLKILRATEDIDFGIAVRTWDDYYDLKSALVNKHGFTNDTKQEQRLWWQIEAGRFCIDLVPFGGIENVEHKIEFPLSGGFEMSTLGFAEVSENLMSIKLTPEFMIPIASLPGLVLLKFIAYNDRPAERQKDIQDIFFIAEKYVDAGNDERLLLILDTFEDADFDYRVAGARLLGQDLLKFTNITTQEIVLKLLNDQSLDKLISIVNQGYIYDEDRVNVIFNTFTELRKGIIEGRN